MFVFEKKAFQEVGWDRETCKLILAWVRFYSQMNPQTDLRSSAARIFWRLGFLATTGRIPIEIAETEVKDAMDKSECVDSVPGFIRTVVGSRLGTMSKRQPDESYVEAKERGMQELDEMLLEVDLPANYFDLLEVPREAFGEIPDEGPAG